MFYSRSTSNPSPISSPVFMSIEALCATPFTNVTTNSSHRWPLYSHHSRSIRWTTFEISAFSLRRISALSASGSSNNSNSRSGDSRFASLALRLLTAAVIALKDASAVVSLVCRSSRTPSNTFFLRTSCLEKHRLFRCYLTFQFFDLTHQTILILLRRQQVFGLALCDDAIPVDVRADKDPKRTFERVVADLMDATLARSILSYEIRSLTSHTKRRFWRCDVPCELVKKVVVVVAASTSLYSGIMIHAVLSVDSRSRSSKQGNVHNRRIVAKNRLIDFGASKLTQHRLAF
jgi:hypothetical protein